MDCGGTPAGRQATTPLWRSPAAARLHHARRAGHTRPGSGPMWSAVARLPTGRQRHRFRSPRRGQACIHPARLRAAAIATPLAGPPAGGTNASPCNRYECPFFRSYHRAHRGQRDHRGFRVVLRRVALRRRSRRRESGRTDRRWTDRQSAFGVRASARMTQIPSGADPGGLRPPDRRPGRGGIDISPAARARGGSVIPSRQPRQGRLTAAAQAAPDRRPTRRAV